MEPNLPPLDMVSVLTWAAFVGRDILAFLALITATSGLAIALLTLLIKGRARLEGRLFDGGGTAWVFAALGCLAPVEEGLLGITRLAVIGILVLSALMWIVVFVLRRQSRPR